MANESIDENVEKIIKNVRFKRGTRIILPEKALEIVREEDPDFLYLTAAYENINGNPLPVLCIAGIKTWNNTADKMLKAGRSNRRRFFADSYKTYIPDKIGVLLDENLCTHLDLDEKSKILFETREGVKRKRGVKSKPYKIRAYNLKIIGPYLNPAIVI